MVFPFGVSVGDFIVGVKLFKDAVNSFSETRGARADFDELSRSLSSLERAFEALGKVKLETDQHRQAIEQNLNACKICLSAFLVDIAKFQKLDATNVTRSRLGGAFRQVQWALCTKDDVQKFRLEIETHIGALAMLLITFQIESAMRTDDRVRKIETTTNDIATKVTQVVQDQTKFEEYTKENNSLQTFVLSSIKGSTDSCVSEGKEQKNALLQFQDKLTTGLSTEEQRIMFNLLQETLRQNQELRKDTTDLRNQNDTLLHHVLEMKDLLRTQRCLPSQVLLQQPVVLHDALGRIAPFHLEFIDSIAAFLAVLQIRFEHVGRPKISRLEFDLRDSARQKPIALRRLWKGVFRPGQNVDMSMMFALTPDHTACPGCQSEENRSFDEGESVQCQVCNLTYRYGLGGAGDGNRSLEAEDLSDLLTLEPGDCEVSEFCRVSIVKPVELKRSIHQDLWECDTCGSTNTDMTPEFCPVCGTSR